MNLWLFALLLAGGIYAVALTYLVWMIFQAARTGMDPS